MVIRFWAHIAFSCNSSVTGDQVIYIRTKIRRLCLVHEFSAMPLTCLRKRNLEKETMFDSIESMNADELLVKRKRGTKKFVFFLAVVCVIFFIIGLLIGYFGRGDGGNSGPSGSSSGDGFDYNKFILDNIDKDKIRENLKKYSSEPRLTGTGLDVDLARTIEGEWRANKLDTVHQAVYTVMLAYPNTTNPNVIQLLNGTGDVVFESHKYEVPLTKWDNNSHVVPPYNSYCPPGIVTGDLVYVNYGRIEDFYFLKNNLSIDVSGKVAIVRYGKIFRGDKISNAEHFNASAVILYSDPHDFNLEDDVNNTYPHSWWLPPSGIQRGTTLRLDGDPQTPLYPSTDYAYRLPTEQASKHMPKIPCQPIGYNDAEKLLSIMAGPVAPELWQGGLHFTYHIGPGFTSDNDTQVRVVVNNYLQERSVHNVIGIIKGSTEPDRYVLVGNHHDAWVFGAVDPLSGSAAITEITRVFGLMLEKGHRPRRTVVFCSWDGEEQGLMGSVEWVEEHLKVLEQRGVAYLNMDMAAVGNFTLMVGTSPLLQGAVYTAAKQVPSPDPKVGKTLYDWWNARPRVNDSKNTDQPYLTYSLGSGSDMAPFYQRAGLSAIDIMATYDEINIPVFSYPLYHSSYETFFAFDSFIDPGFTATDSITKFLAVITSDLANAELLPFTVERYSAAVSDFHLTLMADFQDVWRQHNISVDAFTSAVNNFTMATKSFKKRLDTDKDAILKSPLKLRQVNDQMTQLERAFLDPEGLPGRPAQKHVMFAPSQFDAYRDNSFPGIVDTMFEINHGKQGLWGQLKQQVFIATYIIQGAANTLLDIGL